MKKYNFTQMPMRGFFLLTFILLIACGKAEYLGKALDTIEPDYHNCTVMRVLEGDLFYCRTSHHDIIKIKLMGLVIDNTQKEEAKKFTKSILPFKSFVSVSRKNFVKKPDGTISAFVFLQNEKFLNGYLIENGYAYKSFDDSEAEFEKKFDEIYYFSKEEKFDESELPQKEKKAPWLK